MTPRQELVNKAVSTMTKWEWKRYLQSVGHPVKDDYLSCSALKYHLKKFGDLPNVLHVIMRDEMESQTALNEANRVVSDRAVKYYMGCSNKAFTRLCNEVQQTVDVHIEAKIQSYKRSMR